MARSDSTRDGSLISPLAKLSRAKEHYFALRTEIAPMGGYQSCPVTTERRRGGLEYLFRARDVQEVNERWALIVGDCLFNLRASLDRLVYQLHVQCLGATLTAADERASQFPIKIKQPKSGEVWEETRRLSKAQRAEIESMQPYVRANDEFHYVRNALGIIGALNNIDKHRKLHVVWHAVGASGVPDIPAEYGFQSEVRYGRPLKREAIVARWTFTLPPPEMYVDPEFLQEVVLVDAIGPRVSMNLMALLESLVNSTETVLNRFAKYFPSNA